MTTILTDGRYGVKVYDNILPKRENEKREGKRQYPAAGNSGNPGRWART